MAVLLVAVMPCALWGTTIDPDYRFNIYQDLMNNTYANYLYNLYANDTGFNYQLRDVAGRNTAGNQWFATVYENYYYNLYDAGDNTGNRSVYRRTTGGEIPAVTFSAIGNLIGGFNFMTVEENQPYDYRPWVNVYDQYPDPLESLCLVIKNGSGNFNINFGNPYWWHWTTTPGSAWWNNRAHINSVNEPIAYQISVADNANGEVWVRGDDGNYRYTYDIRLLPESDDEGVITGYHYEIADLTGGLVCRTSGDAVVDTDGNTLYTA